MLTDKQIAEMVGEGLDETSRQYPAYHSDLNAAKDVLAWIETQARATGSISLSPHQGSWYVYYRPFADNLIRLMATAPPRHSPSSPRWSGGRRTENES